NGAVTFAKTLNGDSTLAVNTAGVTTFGGAVGNVTALKSLTTDAAGTTKINGGSVATSVAAGQVYNDDVELGANTILTATTNGAVTFAKTLNGDATLAVNTAGTTTFGGTVGNATALKSLTTDADGTTTIGGGSVATTGIQIYGDRVQLDANTTLPASGVEFKAKVEGHQRELTIDAGAAGVIFGGDVGTAAFPIGELDVESVGNVVINGEIHSSGPVTIESSAGSISGDANNAIRSKGLASFDDTITLKAATGIGAGTPIAVEAPLGVAAKVTTSGGIALRGIGDLVVPAAGLDAPGTISLAASGTISVPSAGTIKGGDVVTTKEILWSVLNATDSGAGSLRQVLLNVSDVGDCNASGTDAVLLFDLVGPTSGTGTTVISLTSQLPDVSAAVTLDGTSAGLVLDGGRTVASGLAYGSSAAGSVLRGVTLRNFTGFGVQLVNAQNVLVDTIVVQSLNTSTSMGLFATGTLTGSRIIGSSFSGGLRGALLVSTRNLAFGELGRGNTLSNNLAAPTNRKFAGTGIRSEGDCTGTIVAGNTFTGNNYGFAFIGARNLALRNNTFTRNSIAGIYIEADSSGSTQTGNTFGTGSERNKVNVLRAKRSRFG
ncbi:MAG: right-handed parallel beta-helix repeat-containing protein, partial [Planctomycetaceae bacterium]